MSVKFKIGVFISQSYDFAAIQTFDFKTFFFRFDLLLSIKFLEVLVVKLFKNHRALRSTDGFSEDYNAIWNDKCLHKSCFSFDNAPQLNIIDCSALAV